MTDTVIILCPFPDAELAERVARVLLDRHLIACAHLPAAGQSLYWWQGNVETASEVYALFKTTADHFADVEASIKSLHPYEVPGIVALPVGAGHAPFLEWIAAETKDA